METSIVPKDNFNVPTEILKQIFELLPICDQIRLESVCKRWRRIMLTCWEDMDGLLVKDSEVTVWREGKIVKFYFLRTEKELRFIIKRCGKKLKNLSVCDFNFQGLTALKMAVNECKDLRKLKLNDLTFMDTNPRVISSVFESLVTLNKLKYFSLTHFDSRPYWKRYCQGIRPKIFNAISSHLTQLQLENVGMNAASFVSMCRRMACTLESLCFKEEKCMLDDIALSAGLDLLTNLRELNLGFCITEGSSSSHLGDVVLYRIARFLHKLESVNLHGAYHITSSGINALLNSVCGTYTLRFLCLTGCRRVDDFIFRSLKIRSAKSPMLTIYAMWTNVRPASINKYGEKKFRFNMVVDEKADASLFFGENRKDWGPNLRNCTFLPLTPSLPSSCTCKNNLDVV